MKEEKFFLKYIVIALVLGLCILFVAKFAGPSILRLYIKAGIGTCKKIPILCMSPTEEINNFSPDKDYIAGLLPYEFPKVSIRIPKGYTVVQEKIKKVYYKRSKHKDKGAVVYILHKEPDFFINLFPQLKKQGINDDYEFIRRTMYARVEDTENLTDTFFVIMKGIFIPDLGDQKKVIMAHFIIPDKKGFINYNLSGSDNYFDCNIISKSGGFFKIYIKDRGAKLDLERVLAIISTIQSQN